MTYKELMKQQDAARRAEMVREFSVETQPTVAMPVVSKIERVQPTLVGVDANGAMVWEGREMARWQMELLRIKYYGDFMAHWMKQQLLNVYGIEDDRATASMELRVSKKWNRKKVYRHIGD